MVNIAATKVQQVWTTALAAATSLYNMAASRSIVVSTLGAIAMKAGSVASAALAFGMKALSVATTLASGGLTLVIPLIVGLVIGISAAVKAVKRGVVETTKFGKVFGFVGKMIKSAMVLFTFFFKLVANVFDGLSDILLSFFEPFINAISSLFDPLFKAIDDIESKFGSFEDFMFELMVRILTPLAEFEIAVKKWSNSLVEGWKNLFGNMIKAGSEFIASPIGKLFNKIVSSGSIGTIGRGLIDLVSQTQPLAPQGATAVAPLPSIATNSINMNNDITNTIEIKNGMSAREAEDVIVRANKRSMRQMANDALRNTSGVD